MPDRGPGLRRFPCVRISHSFDRVPVPNIPQSLKMPMLESPHLEVPGATLLSLGALIILFRHGISAFAKVQPSMCMAIGLAMIAGGMMLLFTT